jgi:N-acetylglucosaminyl-diphospho-decaprenol L-rhamnosyltransferase
MDLGIIVVSYNTRELTCNGLAAAYAAVATAGLEAHVWVVDNASTDGSAAEVRRGFPQATLIASDTNLGFAGGNNAALRAMAALDRPPRYVLLLNSDTEARPDSLGHMVSFLDAHPQVGVVGAQLLYGDGSFQHGAFHFPTLWMALLDFWPPHNRLADSWLNGRYPPSRYLAGEPFAIDHPLGAALMLRWETFEAVGPLDEGFFMYCEEIDWCLRAKRAGWAIYCVPRARVVHLAGQSTRQFRDAMYLALWRSRFRLFDKHYSRAYRWAVRRIVRAGLASEARRVRRALRRGEMDPHEAERRLATYRAVGAL